MRLKPNISLFFILLCFPLLRAQESSVFNHFLQGKNVTDICSDGESLWVATDGSGIYKYSYTNKTWNNYSTSEDNLSHNFFYCIAASERYVWAGSTDGLFILDKRRNNWTKRKFGLGGQLSNWIRSLAYDKYANILWIGRFKFLSAFNLSSRRFSDYDLTVDGEEKSNTITAIAVDGDSLVWFGTESGIHKYNKRFDIENTNGRQYYNNSHNYFNYNKAEIAVSAFAFEDRNVWIGLDEFLTRENPEYNIGGIYKFDRRNKWERFDITDGLAANGIYSLEVTGKYIWASLYKFDLEKKEQYGQGVAIIDRLSNEIQMINDGSLNSDIHKLFFDGKFLWFGTSNGVYSLDLTNSFIPNF